MGNTKRLETANKSPPPAIKEEKRPKIVDKRPLLAIKNNKVPPADALSAPLANVIRDNKRQQTDTSGNDGILSAAIICAR